MKKSVRKVAITDQFSITPSCRYVREQSIHCVYSYKMGPPVESSVGENIVEETIEETTQISSFLPHPNAFGRSFSLTDMVRI